jgi:hypothetical protein
MMEHLTKDGRSKIADRCTYPLTGIGCVNRIFTDLAVLDVTASGLVVVEMVDGLPFDALQRMTGVPLVRYQGSGNRDQGAGSREQGKREQGAGSRETGSREQGTGSRERDP